MAHYAKVTNGIVTRVIVAEQDFIDNMVSDRPGEWIKTSYNTRGGVHYTQDEDGNFTTPSEDQSKALRKNYAGVGWVYDLEEDAFHEPQPYPSWTLNSTSFMWEPPVDCPTDGNDYTWNEETQTWDAVTE